jgi:hypothetical protein
LTRGDIDAKEVCRRGDVVAADNLSAAGRTLRTLTAGRFVVVAGAVVAGAGAIAVVLVVVVVVVVVGG